MSVAKGLSSRLVHYGLLSRSHERPEPGSKAVRTGLKQLRAAHVADRRAALLRNVYCSSTHNEILR